MPNVIKPMAMDLFNAADTNSSHRPLAERLRPKSLDNMVGQPKLLSGSSQWRKQLDQARRAPGARLPSLILFGPPGSGKTTLARILGDEPGTVSENCNAVETGAKALREICERAQWRRRVEQKRTLVFIDEIHRLNRAQQDVLLASLESGDLSLIGATTENPSHALNPALISRCHVLAFSSLEPHELGLLMERGFAEACSRREDQVPPIDAWLQPQARIYLQSVADGDARRLLNAIELLVQSEPTGYPEKPLTDEEVHNRMGALVLRHDRSGESHYDLISAFIKSIRGSDPDASMYYLARLVRAEEDVAFLARRLMILASEDIGNADPRALQVATSCAEAVTRIGWPEARIIFAQAVAYLACAPKSNSSYVGLQKALDVVDKTGSLPIPLALRSSKTKLSKSLGYGEDYRYSHDGGRGFIAQEFLPEAIQGSRFLEFVDRGFEKTMKSYQDWIRTRSEGATRDETDAR